MKKCSMLRKQESLNSSSSQDEFLRTVQELLEDAAIPPKMASYLVNKKLNYLYPMWYKDNYSPDDIADKLLDHTDKGVSVIWDEMRIFGYTT